jgi:hypothetical protein
VPTIEVTGGGGSAEVGAVILIDEGTTGSSTTATADSTLIWPAWCKTQRYTKSDYLTTNIGTSSGSASGAAWTTKVWKNWCTDHWGITTSATTSPWPAWIETHSSTTASVTADPWIVWNTHRTTGTLRGRDVQISNEEYQARRAREATARAEREARYLAESVEREQAKARAQILLRENLTDEQKAELAEKRYFSLGVIDSKTGERRTYRIHQGRSGNVEQVDDNGQRLKRFCIHPNIACPDEDTMLAQKLWLETREAEFLRVANHS